MGIVRNSKESEAIIRIVIGEKRVENPLEPAEALPGLVANLEGPP